MEILPDSVCGKTILHAPGASSELPQFAVDRSTVRASAHLWAHSDLLLNSYQRGFASQTAGSFNFLVKNRASLGPLWRPDAGPVASVPCGNEFRIAVGDI
jgi:hypothetical protein